MMRVNFLMQVNGFLFYYVTIHGYTHIVMRVNFLMQVNCFFLPRHCSWVYPYRDAGRFSGASQLIFVLRHHSWIYPYRDGSQFSDASQRIFLLRHHIMMLINFLIQVNGFLFYYVTIHGYTHIVMRVNFLMQVSCFFTTSLFMGIPIS